MENIVFNFYSGSLSPYYCEVAKMFYVYSRRWSISLFRPGA